MSRTALLVSPHLDDAAFSCGGLAAQLARAGWLVVIATLFTRSVHPATGFALECQRDKGLADDVDYMALRRAEDFSAAACLGAETWHGDLAEAPHRGYHSARALFEPPMSSDAVEPVMTIVEQAVAAHGPALLLAPQGCGRHVDHLLTLDAVLRLREADRLGGAACGFYRDTPYVIRDANAEPDFRVARAASCDLSCPLDVAALGAKSDAACAYSSQIGFQFGGAAATRAALAALARREAGGDGWAERLRAGPELEAALADALSAGRIDA